jgi:hypothetical protein
VDRGVRHTQLLHAKATQQRPSLFASLSRVLSASLSHCLLETDLHSSSDSVAFAASHDVSLATPRKSVRKIEFYVHRVPRRHQELVPRHLTGGGGLSQDTEMGQLVREQKKKV